MASKIVLLVLLNVQDTEERLQQISAALPQLKATDVEVIVVPNLIDLFLRRRQTAGSDRQRRHPGNRRDLHTLRALLRRREFTHLDAARRISHRQAGLHSRPLASRRRRRVARLHRSIVPGRALTKGKTPRAGSRRARALILAANPLARRGAIHRALFDSP